MPTKRFGFGWFFGTCLASAVWAQNPQVAFEHLSLEDGLSQSSVTSITQDRHGFIWIATQDGLNRYDGYTFTVYRHRPDDSLSLAHNRVSNVGTDRKGEIWVGTQNGVVHQYDEATNKRR